jgi:hypothetical protein
MIGGSRKEQDQKNERRNRLTALHEPLLDNSRVSSTHCSGDGGQTGRSPSDHENYPEPGNAEKTDWGQSRTFGRLILVELSNSGVWRESLIPRSAPDLSPQAAALRFLEYDGNHGSDVAYVRTK